MESISRKRIRSDDSPFKLQNKIFVNQQTVNLLDENQMKKIHNKTMNLLFKGAKNLGLNNNIDEIGGKHQIEKMITLMGNGNVTFQGKEKPQGFPESKTKSKCCNKDVFIQADCSTCNLGLCEFCAFSCLGCRGFICGNCINLFGCGSPEEPMCDSCKIYF